MKSINLLLVVVTAVAGIIAGCGDTVNNTYPATAQSASNNQTQRVGTVLIAEAPGGSQNQSFAFGQTNVEIMRIVVAVSMDEDARVEYIVPEFYSQSYGEALPNLLQNIRVIDQNGEQVGPGSIGVMTQNCSQSTTFAWLPVGVVIPKGTVRTLRITADIPWYPGTFDITPLLPSWTTESGMFQHGISDHVIVRGVSSGELMDVKGGVIGSPFYLYDPYGAKG